MSALMATLVVFVGVWALSGIAFAWLFISETCNEPPLDSTMEGPRA